MKTKLQDFIPIYGINSYEKRLIKSNRNPTVKETQTEALLFAYQMIACVVLFKIAEKLFCLMFN